MLEGYMLTIVPPKEKRVGVYRIRKGIFQGWQSASVQFTRGKAAFSANVLVKPVRRVRGKG